MALGARALRPWRRALVALVALACLAFARPARAELAGDVALLLEAWRHAGAHAERAGMAFLMQGQSRRIPLPPDLAAGACVRIVAVAERSIAFSLTGPGLVPGEVDHATLLEGEADPHGLVAVAGVVEAHALCGPERPSEVVLHMAAARGTVEVLFATSAHALEPVDAILLERAVGPVAPRSIIGRAPQPGPLAERLARVRRGAELDAASHVIELAAPAAADGGGAVRMKLSAGCHRVWVLGGDAAVPGDSAPDVDADVRRAAESQPIASDRSHAPDARLELCLGAVDTVDLRFVGAFGASAVTIVDAVWPLPTGLPASWATELQQRTAAALFRRHAPSPSAPPIAEWLGGAGAVVLPLEVEPRRCYLATLGFLHGEPRGARFALKIAGRVYADEFDDASAAGALTFCTGSARRAVLELGVRANTSVWHAAMWVLGKDAP